MTKYSREYYQKNKEKIKKNIRIWQDNNRERVNKVAREYYHKNIEKLRPIIAERQRKYNFIKNPRVLSTNPVAIFAREYRRIFKEKYGISTNQVYRNGKNAIKAVKKSGGRCENCGKIENLQIHHKDGKGRNFLEKGILPNNKLNNLMVLCRSCHATLHKNKNL